ncbi:uncharacterized protein BXZ73DRAFT_75777 [Epithele typhae]|uniref:uncharacterized protein n=1 Tax=Epithele typhae TaxID=378194 RepID=UPI00200822F0|nr:uncharacterized protein BXZ73DRAFT_75777 [Epithele typhae]KAH9940180.1 hypothetical protein BXZ73DRAFT_75777 [Epithele typhae]
MHHGSPSCSDAVIDPVALFINRSAGFIAARIKPLTSNPSYSTPSEDDPKRTGAGIARQYLDSYGLQTYVALSPRGLLRLSPDTGNFPPGWLMNLSLAARRRSSARDKGTEQVPARRGHVCPVLPPVRERGRVGACRRSSVGESFASAAVKEYGALIAQQGREVRSTLEEQKGVSYSYGFMIRRRFGGCALTGYVPVANKPAALLINHCVKRCALKLGLFHYLIWEDDPSRPQEPTSQLIDDGFHAIVAGADTTASVTTSTFARLLADPETYRVRAAARGGRSVLPQADSHRHKEMPYLNAVINERLRMFLPVPGGTQHMGLADGQGFMFSSMYITSGTTVWIHTWSTTTRNSHPYTVGFCPDRSPLAAAPHPEPVREAKVEAGFRRDAGVFVPFSHHRSMN